MLRLTLVVALACHLVVPGILLAQDQEPLVISHLRGPVEIDGMIDEPVWQEIEPIHLVAHAPTYGGTPSEHTEVRVAHDGQHLYVAARLYDSEPSRIQALTLKRNDSGLNNDIFGVLLDTFNDNETGIVFATTPTGSRTDVEVLNDAQDLGDLNFDWNTYWDVAVAQNDEGWFAEYRIPFSSLGYQVQEGRVIMGMSFWRLIPRKEESATYPGRPPRWGFNSVFKPSQTRKIVLEGVESVRPLWVTPYALGGGSQNFALNESGSAYERIDTPAYDFGFDLKYGVTDNLTLDLTVNTDFAQVEADNQQVNLTRFSLFFPEKRQFFQERSSTFEFSLGGVNRLFHSRRIGLVQGEQVRIFGGARLVGRVGRWDIGVLNMQTEASDLLPTENFGVLRLRRQVLNQNSYAGGIFTSRIGRDGSHNIVYGLDTNLRLFDQDFLTVNWAQVFDSEHVASGAGDRSFARARWERRGTEGFGYAFDFSRAGAVFDPGVGFMLRTDYTRLGERLYYGWRPAAGSWVFRHTLGLDGAMYRRNADGTTESADIGPEWQMQTRTGHTFTFGGQAIYEDVRQGFALGHDADVLPGSYWFHNARVSYAMPNGAALRTGATAGAGSFFDGYRVSFGITPGWAVSRHLELSGAYSLDRVVFDERGQHLNAHVMRVRAEVMFSTTLSAATFLQYNSAVRDVITNFRFRYNPREGNDLYVVYNHGIHTDRQRLEPFLPFTSERTLLVKYRHTFDLGF